MVQRTQMSNIWHVESKRQVPKTLFLFGNTILSAINLLVGKIHAYLTARGPMSREASL